MKKCPKCSETDQFQFYPNALGLTCKKCRAKYAREWKRAKKLADPEYGKEYRRSYYHRDIEKSRATQREWRKRNPDAVKLRQAANKEKARREGRYALYRHGVTLAERRVIEERQNGKCAICATNLETTTRPCIDHDHATGAIRGILCNKCNASLGWFEARRESVEAYLAAEPVHPGKKRRAIPEPD